MTKIKLSMIKATKMKNRFWIWLALIFMTIYIAWRIMYTIPGLEEYGLVSFVCGILLVAAETISAVEALQHYLNMNKKLIPEKPEIPVEWYPDVDVLIATHNEETELLYKTVNGCKHMKYPDRRKVHIYICDDGNRPAMAELAKKLGVGYFGLADNKDAKAGNLNHALGKTTSPYVATFDADMIPTSDFLMETVPYMFLPKLKKLEDGSWVEREEDELDENFKIGFIQTPQSFYNADLFQFNFFSERRIPNEQDYFFREINVGRNRSNAPIYAGSNTLIAREALDKVGGISTKTITEDFETGIRIQAEGYSCYAIDKSLAHGLAPTEFKSLIKQRERWGRGCISSLRHVHIILNRRLPLKAKLSYFAAFLYWFTFLRRLVYIAAPILFVVFHVPVVICGWKGLVFIWLPSYLLYNHALKVSSGNIRTQRWSNIVDTVIFPYLIIPILAEFLLIKQTKFHVTNKSRKAGRDTNLVLGLPHLILLAADVLAVFISVTDLVLYQNISGIIVLYWLIVNGLNLCMALFFVAGRQNLRINDRFYVKLPVEVVHNGKVCQGETTDISDTGLGVFLDMPVPAKEEDRIKLKVSSEAYEAEAECRVTHVTKEDGKWKYGLEIAAMSEEQKQEYYQIVYDRHHTLANEMGISVSAFDDVYVNVQKRVERKERSVRKYPRIHVNRDVILADGGTVRLEDINFRYVRLTSKSGQILPDKLTVCLDDGVELLCQNSYIRDGLYEITNYEELLNKEAFVNQILEWDREAAKKAGKVSA